MDSGTTVAAAVLGVLGLCVGSFLSVVIDRVARGESMVTVSSHCEVCNVRLGAVDMVPVLSYLFLRGRCRHCGATIPAKLPLVEFFTGLVFAYIGYEYGFGLSGGLLLAYTAILIVVFMIDLERELILNQVVILATAIALVFSAYRPDPVYDETLEVFWRSLAGGGIALGALLAIYLLSSRGIGGGDVKIAPFLGLITGFPVVGITLLMAFVGGGLVAILLILARIRSRKQRIPFGPFLALSTLASLFWGDTIYDWYIGLF